MKYKLDILDSIIQDAINSPEISKKEFKNLKKTVQTESSQIKKALVKEVFSLENDKCIELYIRNHQNALIRLSDKIFENLNQSGDKDIWTSLGDPQAFTLKKMVHYEIDTILTFIKSYFSRYFNHHGKIPEQYRVVAQKELREQNRRLYHHLKSEKDCPLLDIAFYPIKKFHEAGDPVSFQRLVYLKELIKIISHSCLLCSENTINCTLRTNLIYLNFNSYRFFTFLTREITDEYMGKDTIQDQIKVLCYYVKYINQVQIKPNFIFKPEQKPLNEQLLNWLMEEISYLEKKRELSSSMARDNKDLLNKDFKIITDQSVSQVAFFLKLLVDVGVITNRNQRELIQFVASNIQTKQTTHISPESLRTKYYHVDEGTVEAVKDTIIKLLNEIQNKK